jgi:dTDP-4-dehydrorhamnose 3,5-epimerase
MLDINLNNKIANISDLLITPLKEIDVVGGNVLHALKASDSGYVGFGEAYFSNIEFGAVKAWKLHNKMTLNLIVPLGSVRFVVYDNREGSSSFQKFDEVIFSRENFSRFTIPPKLWFGFQGLDKNTSLILNVANIEHDPKEVERKEIIEINYNWEHI